VFSAVGVNQKFLEPHQNFQCHQGLDLGMVCPVYGSTAWPKAFE
jgi:hypothetical protein